MVDPAILLGLPRSGTKLLKDLLGSHPDLPPIIHEFNADEQQFLKHPYVLSNYYQEWMSKYNLIWLSREDSIAGARSMALMNCNFPDKKNTVFPNGVIEEISQLRIGWDKEFEAVAGHSLTYEGMTNNNEITRLPATLASNLCRWLGVPDKELTTRNVRPEVTVGVTVVLADRPVDVGRYVFSTPIRPQYSTKQARMERIHYEILGKSGSAYEWFTYEDGVRTGDDKPGRSLKYGERRGQRLLWQTLAGWTFGRNRKPFMRKGDFTVVVDVFVPFHLKLYADFM